MSWNLNSDRPIFLQIIEHIQLDIISGVYKPGDKLPSVRELAAAAAVNPNTMQKALSELERSGLMYSHRTSGRFITEDVVMIEKMKEELAADTIKSFFESMSRLGITKDEAITLIEKKAKETEK